jgi:hypothetical protein
MLWENSKSAPVPADGLRDLRANAEAEEYGWLV